MMKAATLPSIAKKSPIWRQIWGQGVFLSVALVFGNFFLPNLACASHLIDGSQMPLQWTIPFVGVLLSLALLPLIAPTIWHRHYGKISGIWGVSSVVAVAIIYGGEAVGEQLSHVILAEYIPFMMTIGALYTVSGGIHIKVFFEGTPRNNLLFMAFGALLASWIGTTGAAMLLIRPFMSMNKNRHYRRHSVVFFIFLVCNVGGCLTALGDPPLFLGYLMGVHFFWPTTHLFGPFLVIALPLLCVYFGLDSLYYHREKMHALKQPLPEAGVPPVRTSYVSITSWHQILLFAGIIGSVIMSGSWRSGVSFSLLGTTVMAENLLRDLLLGGIIAISLFSLNQKGRIYNDFCWEPLKEVGKIFAAIFITAAPVIAMLQAGKEGAFATLVSNVTDSQGNAIPALYYWMTGSLSAVLDNAPTYLVFFHMAGGNAAQLMTTYATTLVAISCGAVFMGALTYIGNAPNFMVKAMAEKTGIQMPSFFGYIGWSIFFFVPWLLLISWYFF